MKWAKHVTTLAIIGTLLGIACSSDDESDAEAAAGTAGSAGSAGATTSTGGDGQGEGGTAATPGAGGAQAGSPSDAGGAAGAGGDASPVDPQCRGFGVLCELDTECCSGSCDLSNNTCASTIGACKDPGGTCDGPTDCCSFHCVNGSCSDQACISDNQACTADVECCGGKCVDLACVPLNAECSTAGNECGDSSECCSQLCDMDGRCSLGASYCIQPGDACVRNQDCCSGECNMADGDLVGTCNLPPEGSTFCSGVDGVLCNDCGDCCSRLCAPYQDTGVKICQPVSGCHSTGDLCRSDEDCCGGVIDPELPGYGNGECQLEEGHAIGICRNPVNGEENPDGACSPQGNVCHLKEYACSVSSARNNCCGGVGNSGVCQPDLLGVPRCNGLGDTCRCGYGTAPDGDGNCVPSPGTPGQTCASADDCCDDLPCVPDADGVLRCGGEVCVMPDGGCTIDGDCCSGATCVHPPGSTTGTCEAPPDDQCTYYGQLCTESGECCLGVPCTDGRCKYPSQ